MSGPPSSMGTDARVIDDNQIPLEGSADDDETFEETLEGTLEGTLEETLEGALIDAPPIPTGTELMVLNATKAMVLALARTAPVEISSSMAFKNAIDMDNLCRVRTEDSMYSTIYRPGSRRWSRRSRRGRLHRGMSRGSLATSEGDIEDIDDDSLTFQTWNTVQTDQPSEDDDDESQQEADSQCAVFNIETAMHGVDEKSDDTREQPDEELVLFRASGDVGDMDAGRKHFSWFGTGANRAKKQLTTRHQNENEEIAVDGDKMKIKQKFKRGRRIVRFLLPIAKIMNKNKKTEQPLPANSISSTPTMQQPRDETLSPAIIDDESISKESSTMNQSLEQNSVTGSDSNSSNDRLDESVTSNTAVERSVASDTLAEHSVLTNGSEGQVSEGTSVTSCDQRLCTLLGKINELVRDSSDDNGFEVEVSPPSSTHVAQLFIRDESCESKKCSLSVPLQSARSVQSVRTSMSRSNTLQSTKTIQSSITKSRSLPSKRYSFWLKPLDRTPVEQVTVDEQSCSTWGSYTDDDESKAPPLIVPRNINLMRGGSRSTAKNLRAKPRARSYCVQRVSSTKSILTRSKSEITSEVIKTIEEEPEDVTEKEAESTGADNQQDQRSVLSENIKLLSETMAEEVPTKNTIQNGYMIADADGNVDEEFSRVDLPVTPRCVNLQGEDGSKEEVTEPTSQTGTSDVKPADVLDDMIEKVDQEQQLRSEEVQETHQEDDGNETSTCGSIEVKDTEFFFLNDNAYVVSSIVEEEIDCDTFSICQLPGFEVLEIPTEVNGLIEI